MSFNILKKLNQYHFKRYVLVLALFALVYFYGKNTEVIDPKYHQLIDQIAALQKKSIVSYSVSADQNNLELKNVYLIEKGQCGRLFLGVKNLTASELYTDENPSIKVLLKNGYDEKQEIGSVKLDNNDSVQNKKIEFCATADYQNLLFKKDQYDYESTFEVSNLSFFPLSIEKRDFNDLLSPVEGKTDFSKIVYQSNLDKKSAGKTLKFNHRKQIIGQTFIADSEMISGVDLKLEFLGNGGRGSYFLDLREATEREGKIQLSTERIAYFCFDKKSADKRLKVDENIYHIPLAAKLEKGKSYFVGISNESVEFNIFNTLNIFGKLDANNGKIITSVGGKTDQKSGSIYLKMYGADFVAADNERVLTGAMVLDNGNSRGQYLYEQNGTFSDYLDIEHILSKENNNTNIFYDNVVGGVSGKDKDDNAFIYKINTIHPFVKLKIEASQPGGGFTNSLIYYSLDNINWQEIKSDWDKEDALPEEAKNKFQEVIIGDEKIAVIYIKTTYSKSDAKEKSAHIFGLKNLKVSAELNIK